MKKKKGFTLIELIAVLVIMAIIALIVTPLVLNIINRSRISANKRSVDAYGKAIEMSIATYLLDTGKYPSSIDDLTIEYSGKEVVCNKKVINEDYSIYLSECSVGGKEVKDNKNKDGYYHYGKLNTLMSAGEVSAETDLFLSTEVQRGKIISLNIVNSINIPTDYQSSDCSEKQDKSVMCWWKENNENSGYYDMYIGAKGIVYAPSNSYKLFAYVGYDKMPKLDLGQYFDTSQVTNMSRMFNWTGRYSMTTLNLGDKFNTSNVTDMGKMFYFTGHISMTTLNLGDKFDTSKVTNMEHMFERTGYTSMTTLDLGQYFDTSNVTNMCQMFYETGYTSMITLNLGDKFDTSNVTNMGAMFYDTGYSKMTELNLGNKFDTSKVTDMGYMFYGTGYSKMTELNLGDKFNTSKVTEMQEMFNQTGYTSMTILNLGTFGVNHLANVNLPNLFSQNYNNLQKIIVKNENVKSWLNNQDSTNIPDSIKNIIKIEGE